MLTSYLKIQLYVQWLSVRLSVIPELVVLRSILENVLLETMYDLPSRTDVGTVFINEAVINGEAEPVYKSERQPKEAVTHESVAKADLKVIDSKSA